MRKAGLAVLGCEQSMAMYMPMFRYLENVYIVLQKCHFSAYNESYKITLYNFELRIHIMLENNHFH